MQVEADFETVRDYLYGNPKPAGIVELSEKTGVKMRVIRHLLKEKRLYFTNPTEDLLTCEVCHKPIPTGRICDECKELFIDKLHDIINIKPEQTEKPERPEKEKKVERMHINVRERDAEKG
jgi:hypothetical protein